MTFLVILFFFGLSAGVVAKIKGHSLTLWFLVGFCLPFLGTVAALAAPNTRRAPPRLRRCTECPHVLPVHVQVCTRCGADLPFPEAESFAVSPEGSGSIEGSSRTTGKEQHASSRRHHGVP